MAKSCEKPTCSTSTGIHGGLTFGRGELDDYGYWEYPCQKCAREWDEQRKPTRAKIARELRQEGKSKCYVRRYIACAEWLWFAGWPFDKNLLIGD